MDRRQYIKTCFALLAVGGLKDEMKGYFDEIKPKDRFTDVIHLPRIPYPVIVGDYHHIYHPAPDIYYGDDTHHFINGQLYETWIPNDFTYIQKGDELHFFGITHPKPDSYIDSFNFNPWYVHAGENQLFHAVYKGSLSEKKLCIEKPKILWPHQRPNETEGCWAPCIVERDGLYYLFYSPFQMRLAISKDLYNWEPKGTLFSGSIVMRDPYIYFDDGLYTMVYVEDHLYYRTSNDLLTWSDPSIFQENPFPGASQESPAIYKREGIYYLLWCIYDGQNSCYDNRTFVFASDSLLGFKGKAPITLLRGHAPELHFDGDKTYILSVFYPNNGLNVAPVEWKMTAEPNI